MGKSKANTNTNIFSTGYLFSFIANDWQRKLNVILTDFSLDVTQYALLSALNIHHESEIVANQVMLSEFTGIDKMTTSKTMRILEDKKLLKRKESKIDSRAKSVEISEKGKKLLSNSSKELDKFEKDFFEKLYKADKNIDSKLELVIA